MIHPHFPVTVVWGGRHMYLVFTDLDGTLLDHDTYSWEAARPALDRLKRQQVPWTSGDT